MQEANKNISTDEFIFALDIGTRSIIGIIAKQEGKELVIIDSQMIPHPDRNMFDGQIHDIEGVVAVVKEVKRILEERNDLKLTKVGIAAAGRSLKTQQLTVNRTIDSTIEIDRALVNNLEMEAIQTAQSMLDEEEKKNTYYCVGYTVINYYLNNSAISSLIGHKGEEIAVNLIATFLPHIVVDSLYTVMHRVGLEIINLTLEPIAAINIAIPPKARLLNLAMVDIGAGTSDIAITKEGTITSYAMTTTAGDKITEMIAQNYLLDFDQAEELKLKLCNGGKQTFSDIVGIDYELETEEILDSISPILETMADQIAENIMLCNQKAPSAVFLVGGSSQIPRLPDILSTKLSLPKERVVVKGSEIMKNLQGLPDFLKGPDAITPLGIVMVTLNHDKENFFQITVNDQRLKMFNSKQLFISDALILLGYEAKKLLPKRGPGLNFILNGKSSVIPGLYGEAGKIFLNGELSSVEAKIKEDDVITLEEATSGTSPTVFIKDILPESKTFWVENQGYPSPYDIRCNNQKAILTNQLKENDAISWKEINTVQDLLEYLGYAATERSLYLDGKRLSPDHLLQNNDQLSLNSGKEIPQDTETAVSSSSVKIAANLNDPSAGEYKFTVFINERPVTIHHNKAELMLFDLFNYIDLDIQSAKNPIIIKINDKDASFTDSIKNHDHISIKV
ncbi:MAG: cell division protein FtsA [bacterium]